jgi:DNA processing protein
MSEAAYYNVLAIRHIGSYTRLQRLYQTHGSWQVAYEKTADGQTLRPEDEFKKLEKLKIRIILAQDAEFPPLLHEIPWTPHALYVRGSLPKLTSAVAIVGTRKATPTGLQFARTTANELARRGVPIISGLALGMDAAAHQGVVDAGGVGVAVLASGLEKVTPRTNELLGNKILELGGAIISEYPLGTQAIPRYFLERNRIVSGLSKAVVVIEAPKRSGTLATARFAIEQNRELLVVPGGVGNINYEGSHELIKQGAQLITETTDILRAIGLANEDGAARVALPFLDETQQKIITYLTEFGEPVHTDALADAVKLPIASINEALAMLSVMDAVKEDNGKYYV